MPRKLTAEEIQSQKDIMFHKGIALIKAKGLRNITLDDITNASFMAKGSFYHYYQSKEQYLYEVVKRSEKQSFDAMLATGKTAFITKEEILNGFKSFFLSEECLYTYLVPEDLEYLLLKLPKEISTSEQNKSENNFHALCEMLGIKGDYEFYGTLSYLLDGLQAIYKSPAEYGEAGRKNAAMLVVTAIADYIYEEKKKDERSKTK